MAEPFPDSVRELRRHATKLALRRYLNEASKRRVEAEREAAQGRALLTARRQALGHR